MNPPPPRDSPLSDIGLNLQAVFDIADLPAEIVTGLEQHCHDFANYRQLILFAHGGRTLWNSLQRSGFKSDDPIDDFTTQAIRRYFEKTWPDAHLSILYPGTHPIGLQRLGLLAGWHHPTPFQLGIHETWGTWFAYRAVVLTDTHLEPTARDETKSPCDSCNDKVCITSCPGAAMDENTFSLQKCVAHRKQPGSECRDKCISRISCPVGTTHQYSKEQIRYHYLRSMRMIEEG